MTPPSFEAFESPIIASRKVRCRASLPETSIRYPKLMNCKIGILAVMASKMTILAIPKMRDANIDNAFSKRKGQLFLGEFVVSRMGGSQGASALIKWLVDSQASETE